MSVSIVQADNHRFTAVGVISVDNAMEWVKQGEVAMGQVGGSIQFDLSGIQQTSSVGLSVLLSWMRSARKRSIELSFTGMPSAMFDIARVSGLDDVLPIQRPSVR